MNERSCGKATKCGESESSIGVRESARRSATPPPIQGSYQERRRSLQAILERRQDHPAFVRPWASERHNMTVRCIHDLNYGKATGQQGLEGTNLSKRSFKHHEPSLNCPLLEGAAKVEDAIRLLNLVILVARKSSNLDRGSRTELRNAIKDTF
jgi:hypothetical protein